MLIMFHKQRGIGLITSLFLISGMLIIGLSFMLFITEQKQNTALDILHTKAYFAAKAGIDISAYNSINLNNCSNQSINLGNSLYINISCSRITKQENGQTITVDQVISTGCYNNQNASCPSSIIDGQYAEKQIIAYMNP